MPTPRYRCSASTVTALRCNVWSNEPRRGGRGKVMHCAMASALVLDDVVVDLGVFECLEEIVTLGRVIETDRETRTDALDRVEFVVQGDRDIEVLDAAASKRVAVGQGVVEVASSSRSTPRMCMRAKPISYQGWVRRRRRSSRRSVRARRARSTTRRRRCRGHSGCRCCRRRRRPVRSTRRCRRAHSPRARRRGDRRRRRLCSATHV